MNDHNFTNRPRWVKPHVSPESGEMGDEVGRAPHLPQRVDYESGVPQQMDLTSGAAQKGTGKFFGACGRVGSGCYHLTDRLGHFAIVGMDAVFGRLFRGSGPARFCGFGLVTLVVGFISLGMLYFFMGAHSLPVNFLKDNIERSLAASFGDARVKIENAVLQRDTVKGGLFVRLTNMELRGEGGERIAATPEIGIGLKVLPMMWGSFEPDSINIIAPEIHLIRNEAGDWTLRRSQSSQTVNQEPIAEKTIEAIIDGEASSTAELARLGDIVKHGLESAHKQLQQSINFTHIGVRKARVVLHSAPAADGTVSDGDVWLIPSFTLQYDPEGRRKLVGSGVIQHYDSPGAEAWVSLVHTQGSGSIEVKSRLQNIIPSELSALVPVLESLRPVQVGVSGDLNATIDLDNGLEGGHLKVALSDGHISIWGDEGPRFLISRGAFEFDMEAGAKHVVMKRGDLFYPNGTISLKGDVWRENVKSELSDWRFQLYSTAGELYSDDPEINGSKIDEFRFSGRLFGARAPVSVDEFRARIGKSQVTMAHDDSHGYPAILRGQVTHVPVNLIKAIWPEGFKTESRDWVFENVKTGLVSSGQLALEAPGFGERIVLKGEKVNKTVLPYLKINVTNLAYTVFDDPLLIKTGHGVVEINGMAMTARMKSGSSELPNGGKLTIVDGKLHIPDYEPTGPDGEIEFKFKSDTAFADGLLQRKPFEYQSVISKNAKTLKGSIDGQLKISMPLSEDVPPEKVVVDGMAHMKGAEASFEKFDIKNGDVNFTLGKNYVEAKGSLLINGVSSEISWGRQIIRSIKQPSELTISGVYDEADRNQLGLYVNSFVQGAVPVEIVLAEQNGKALDSRVLADLTKATIDAKALGWKKASGTPATLKLDVAKAKNGLVTLTNIRIDGQDLTARGEIGLDEEHHVSSFEFPNISYKVVSNISISGELDKNKIWQVKAGGKAYDGRGLLKSMLRTGQVGAGAQGDKQGRSKGIVLKAKFDTVLGWKQSKLSRFKIDMRRKGDVLTKFVMGGTLLNGGSLTANLVSEKEDDPVIRVRSSDAGEALRFVGFYPNMLGGNGQLKVRYNVKSRQLASKTGQLEINRFSIASDPVVKEVLANISQGKKTKSVNGQDIIPFNRLVAPFSIGQGQFVLHESHVRGDLLGATMRGRIDFENERVRLAGTYIPLYGLNAAVGAVPVLGDILVGRRGEGMLGITFGVFGNIQQPEVLVNPMSLVAPGVFRQIFEFEQGTPSIKARPNKLKKQELKLDSSASKVIRRKDTADDGKRPPETSASSVVRRGAATN